MSIEQKKKESLARIQAIKTTLALKNGDAISLVLEEINRLIDIVTMIPKGDTGSAGKQGPKWEPTNSDLKVIAGMVKIPVVEKVVEKTQIIKEQPIIQDNSKVIHETIEVPKPMTREEILSVLKDGIPYELVKGIPASGIVREMPVISLMGSGRAGRGNIIVRNGSNPIGQDIRILNVIGSGVTVTRDGDGIATLNISGGGAGFTELPATGTINSVNTAFTFTQKPTYIVSDGAWYKENDGWTWSGLTATMTIPPNNSIYGVA